MSWRSAKRRCAAILLAGLTLQLAACGSSAPSQSPDVSAGGSASVSGSPGSAPGATPEPTPFAPPNELAVGAFAEVVAETLNVHTEPSADAPLVYLPVLGESPSRLATLGTATLYRHVFMLDGPVSADGFEWFLVAPTEESSAFQPEFRGWVARGDGEDAWVEVENPCPAPPVELEDLTYAATSWAVRMGCFTGQQLTLQGWFPELPPDIPATGVCPSPPAFLVCPPVQDIRTATMNFYDPRNVNRLDFTADPTSGVLIPARGQWIEIIGQFDHPVAAQCPTDTDLGVLMCRVQFVISAARPLGAG